MVKVLPAEIPWVSGSAPSLENSVYTMKTKRKTTNLHMEAGKGGQAGNAKEGHQFRGEVLETVTQKILKDSIGMVTLSICEAAHKFPPSCHQQAYTYVRRF